MSPRHPESQPVILSNAKDPFFNPVILSKAKDPFLIKWSFL